MADSDAHFKGYQPHTLLKLRILKTYFAAWARKLLLRPTAGDAVYYVDACAGQGQDDLGNHGSPLLAAMEAQEAERQLAEQFNRRVFVHVVAIEKRPKRYRTLATTLAPFANTARALCGTLSDHMDALIHEMGEAPALFFIDPFGLSPLRADVVYRALARPRTEVFLLFADQAALRHYGVITADQLPADASAPIEQSLFDMLCAPDAPVAEASVVDDEADSPRDLSNDGPLPNKASSEAIMDAAFGTIPWRARVAAQPKDKRRALLDGYRELLHDAGARYVLEIPMLRRSTQRVYHLFHATRSPHGYVTMKQAIASALNQAEASPWGTINTMRFMIRSNMAAVAERVRGHFAGRRAPWTSKERVRNTPCGVREFALQETEAYPFDLDRLKTHLEPLRDRSSRALLYDFPAISAANAESTPLLE